MPVSKHLNWLDITDFSPGLFTEPSALKQFSMPQNAAQQMDNCVPIRAGGLRAFFKPTSVSTSGVASIANESVMGIGLRAGIALRSGASGDGTDRYLITFNPNDMKVRLYRMDGSNGETTWKQKDASYTFTAGTINAVRSAALMPFHDSAGADWMLLCIRGGGNSGLWKAAYVAGAGPPAGDGVITKMNSATGPLTVNQARIILGDGGAVVPYRLYYGDLGLTTGAITTLANFVDIAPYQDGAGLTMLSAMEPSDILIGRESAPWTVLQGDISSASTAVREMGSVHTGAFTEQQVARTPDGIVYIEPGGRIYATDGRNFTDISWQLDRFYKIDGSLTDHVDLGQMAFLGQWLFCPQGYVRDWETGSWLRATDLSNASHFVSDARRQKIWGVNGGASFTMFDYVPFDRQSYTGSGVVRYNTYTWRSAPFAQPDGRQTRIREVQVFLDASAAGSISITRTNADGTTVTKSHSVAVGRTMISTSFPNSGSLYQDITITPSATSSSNEAPIIERVRFAFAPGRLVQ